MKRRTFLAGGSAVVLGGLSGCSLRGSEPMARYQIINMNDPPHTVKVTIRDESEVIHEKEHQIGAGYVVEKSNFKYQSRTTTYDVVLDGEKEKSFEFQPQCDHKQDPNDLLSIYIENSEIKFEIAAKCSE